MKKLLTLAAVLALSTPITAYAADLPQPPPMPRAPAFVAPPFSWTGFYLGGNLGAGWNHGNISDSTGLYTWGADNSTTFVGGGQVGANYQFSNVVVGIEADFDWFANNNNSGAGTAIASGPAAGSVVQGSNNGRWLTTVTGRVGLAADRLLGYIKGGGAWVGSNNLTLTNLSSGGSVSIGNGNTNTGWVAGAGLEWAFANNWTAKIEYDYVGLSDKSTTVTIPGIGPDTFSTNNRNVQMVTVGVNYLFNFGNY